MKALLKAMELRIKDQLPYLRWVGVLDSHLLPPEGPGFPIVGLKDDGIPRRSQPGKKDIEELNVIVYPYQNLIAKFPGASVMGNDRLQNKQGRGLLDIGKDLIAALDDNFLGLNFHFAHSERIDKSETLTDDGARMIQFQAYHYLYRRYQ